MNFDPPAPPDRAAVLSHTDGLDMKVSTRQKQGATRHKGVGAKGDNSAFPGPTWPPIRCLISEAPHAFVSQRVPVAGHARGTRPTGAVRVLRRVRYTMGCYSVYIISSTPRTIINSGQVFWKTCCQLV